ncbi:hypothetical protein LXL04_004922 [Taraxacum kok-saghyz]
MASLCFYSAGNLHYNNSLNGTRPLHICKQIRSSQSTIIAVINSNEPNVRRSANYEPSIWSFDHVQSLSNKYKGEDYVARANTLREVVKTMIHNVGNPLSALELVDDMQRLGISYHFEDEINEVLDMIYYKYFLTDNKWSGMGLNLKALGFRLLRQHGYQVPQGDVDGGFLRQRREKLRSCTADGFVVTGAVGLMVAVMLQIEIKLSLFEYSIYAIMHAGIFGNFKDKTQDLNPNLLEDVVGMLNLYEASYHSFEGEDILDEVRDCTTEYLQENLDKFDGSTISLLVSHALELPLHWRVPRVEAKWFIEVYEKSSGMDPTLIEFAKLDFNMVQAIHIEDLKHSSRWWTNTKWDKKLSFARDRLVENFLWTVGVGYQPQFSHGRRTLTKVNSIITTIDDIYDVFGTLDELEQFTDATSRWDINVIEELPYYMKICFLGLYNSINEIAYSTLIKTGSLVLSYLKKAWEDLCKSYLVEARWYQNGHTPTLDEYLENAWVSISGPVILMHVNFLTSIGSTKEILQCMDRVDNIVRCSSIILRLADDLGTSSDEMVRGDIPKSIQCYMHESGATEEEARSYIKNLINKTWNKLNKERSTTNSTFLRELLDYATNLARMALFMYEKGDGHGRPNMTKFHVYSLLLNPIEGLQ